MSALVNKRHEEFAKGVANGLSIVAAYRAAFPNSLNWQEASVEARADDLIQRRTANQTAYECYRLAQQDGRRIRQESRSNNHTGFCIYCIGYRSDT